MLIVKNTTHELSSCVDYLRAAFVLVSHQLASQSLFAGQLRQEQAAIQPRRQLRNTNLRGAAIGVAGAEPGERSRRI